MSEAARAAAREIAELYYASPREVEREAGFIAAIIEKHMGAGVRTLRDEFAMAALPDMIRLSMERDGSWSFDTAAYGAYQQADAMLAARGTPTAARAEEGTHG